MTTPRLLPSRGETDPRPEKDRGIDNVGRLTPGAGSESSTRKSSDLKAAEALQEAETEVGTKVLVGSGARVAGQSGPTDPVIDVGLTA